MVYGSGPTPKPTKTVVDRNGKGTVTVDLSFLDDYQSMAVDSAHRRLRVLAGPGSGKTRVLTRRVAHLVRSGTAPERVMAVTFTNKAARELRRRLEGILGAAVERLWLGTFHGISIRLLRWKGDAVGVKPSFLIYDEDDAKRLMREIVSSFIENSPGDFPRLLALLEHREGSTFVRSPLDVPPLDQWKETHFWCSVCHAQEGAESVIVENEDGVTSQVCLRCLRAFRPNSESVALMVHALREQADIARKAEICDATAKVKLTAMTKRALLRLWKERNGRKIPDKENVLSMAAGEYEKRLSVKNALDFDGIILRALELCRHPAAHSDIANRFDHVLVDEFQDVSHPQASLTIELASQATLTVVGDKDQSIYSWRGADSSILDSYAANTVYLPNNYRSTSTIVKAARAVLPSSPAIVAVNSPVRPDPVLLRVLDDADMEAEYVSAEIMRSVIEEKLSYSDFAVIYRTNRTSKRFEAALPIYKVPYRLYGGTSFYQRKEVKDILAYLRLVQSDNEDDALRRIINVPARRIGKGMVASIEREARRRRVPLMAAVRSDCREPPVKFAQLVDSLRDDLGKLALGDFIARVIERTSYVKSFRRFLDADEREENLEELVDDARRHVVTTQDPSLATFLQKISLVSPERSNSRIRGEYVSLMTAHRAKGLEFEVVFIVGAEDGLFPYRGFGHDDDEEDVGSAGDDEEARLFYVAATRAKRRLYLTATKRRGRWNSELSPFVTAISDALDRSEFVNLNERSWPRAEDAP